MDEERVVFDDEKVTRSLEGGRTECVRWDDLREVFILTTAAGPFEEDVFWMLAGNVGGCAIPAGMAGFDPLLTRLQQLPGFDNEAVIAAMTSVGEGRFVCWHGGQSVAPASGELVDRIQMTADGHLPVFAVLQEDHYETILGDGYYAYFEQAFFNRRDAEEFALEKTGEWQKYHVREGSLRLENDEFVFDGNLPPFEKIELEKLIESLNARIRGEKLS